jgi:hypothetical protein
MAPFSERPDGFSKASLALLDDALNLLWLEQVAVGASSSGAKLPRGVLARLDRLSDLSPPASRRRVRGSTRAQEYRK